jgi:rhodanese-related sulfurtransferase
VRLPWAAYDARVLVLCQEGYASSLAAAALVRLGLTGATDVVGGLRAWRQAGLPMAEPTAAV